MDGLVELAYLTQDANLLALSKKWVDSVILSMDEEGMFGPKSNKDWWPRAVALKALATVYRTTHDERIPPFMTKYLSYQLAHLEESPFDFWGYARGMEGKIMFDLLEGVIPNDLREKVWHRWQENTLDWNGFFADFPYPQATEHYLNRSLFLFLKPFLALLDRMAKSRKKYHPVSKQKILAKRTGLNRIYLTTHGVNLAMAIKYLSYDDSSLEGAEKSFHALDLLRQYHGTANGLFSSDEHLSGNSPEQGVELCTVVELMYSMEEVFRHTSSMRAIDELEFIAYNALAATITPDFTAHQYVQQTNQWTCSVHKNSFFDADKYANTFGVEPNFGCCAANMHQGWPKFMSSAVWKQKNEIVIASFVSGIYQIFLKEGMVRLQIETNYPYSDEVRIHLLEVTSPKSISVRIRIPYQVKTTMIRHGETSVITDKSEILLRQLVQGGVLSLTFHFEVEVFTNPDKSVSIRRGPLLFSRPIPSKEEYLFGPRPFHDRAFVPKGEVSPVPPLILGIRTDAMISRELHPSNFFQNRITLQLPESRDISFVPYASAVLRQTHFQRREV